MYDTTPAEFTKRLGERLETDPPAKVIGVLIAVVYENEEVALLSQGQFDPFRLKARIDFDLYRMQEMTMTAAYERYGVKKQVNLPADSTPEDVLKIKNDLFEQNYRNGGF